MTMPINSGLEFIDRLLMNYRISLRTVSSFAEQYGDELQRAQDIFALGSERDQKLCQALFRLLSKEEAKELGDYFCRKYQIQDRLDDIFFEENKLFLIAAFVCNPAFFTLSWNICGLIKTEMALEGESQQPIQTQTMVLVWFAIPDIIVRAASSSDPMLREIWSKNLDQEGVKGELRVLANNADEKGRIQFCFKFKEFLSPPPYYLTVRYTTESDKQNHVAELNIVDVNNIEEKELIIVSKVQRGVRYTEGITNIRIEVQKLA